MNFKGHIIGSAVVAVALPVVARMLDVPLTDQQIAYMIPATILGGNFPDLDTQSVPSKFYAIVGLIASVYFMLIRKWEYAAFVMVPFFVAKMGKHRGWTHSYFVPAGFLAGGYFFPQYNFILSAFAVGHIVHLILDSIWIWKRKSWVSV